MPFNPGSVLEHVAKKIHNKLGEMYGGEDVPEFSAGVNEDGFYQMEINLEATALVVNVWWAPDANGAYDIYGSDVEVDPEEKRVYTAEVFNEEMGVVVARATSRWPDLAFEAALAAWGR